MDIAEVQSVLKNMIQSNYIKRIPLVDLERIFSASKHLCLRAIAVQNGFSSTSAMIASWSGFKVTGTGLQTKVELEMSVPAAESNDKICTSPAVEQACKILATCSLDDSPTYINKVHKTVPQCRVIVECTKTKQIVLLHSINPSRFWFCEHQEKRELQEQIIKMGSFYQQNMDLKISDHHLQPGLHVAVKRQDAWHRGKIVKLIEPKLARVFFVDFGMTEDVSYNERVRYLREDFARMPALAHRGTLAYVLPKQESWGIDSIKFMKKRCGQQFEAKIQRRDDSSQCYFLAIRKSSEEHQLSDSLISMGAGIIDSSFLERDGVPHMKEFRYYEDGLHLDETDDDDWLPKTPKKSGNRNSRLQLKGPEKVSASVSTSKITPAPTEKSRKMKIFVQDKKQRLEMPKKSSVINSRLQPLKVPQIGTSNSGSVASTSASTKPKPCEKVVQSPIIPCEPPTSVLRSEPPTSVLRFEPPVSVQKKQEPERTQTDPEPSQSKSRPLGVQDLSKLSIGMKTAILVHMVYDRENFYFFFKEDLLRHLEFQENFKASCVPNQNFEVGSGVITFYDENYCRGRITEVVEHDRMFKILLIDIGVIVSRTREEIFKLDDEYWLYPAAAYHGQLANIPEHVHIKTAEDLTMRTYGREVKAQIVRIVGTKVELRLLN